MIQVTGFLKGNGTYYKDPRLELVPHLLCPGKTALDVNIIVDEVQVGAIGYLEIDKAIFLYSEGNAYDFLISQLESFVITTLTEQNPDCEFESFQEFLDPN